MKIETSTWTLPENTRVTVIPIKIGALKTFPKDLVRGREELEIGGRAENI